MRTVKDISVLHALAVALNLTRIVIDLGCKIPELENMKSLLGADGDTNNGVFGVGRDQTKNGSGSVALKGFQGICLRNLDTVRAAVDVGAMLPQR
jgi:hypothetical protein